MGFVEKERKKSEMKYEGHLCKLLSLVFLQVPSCCLQLRLGLLFLVLPYLPASNALFHVGFVVAERVLYTPR